MRIRFSTSPTWELDREDAQGGKASFLNTVRVSLAKITVFGSPSKSPKKPAWVNLPDSVWQRHSALIMSSRDRKG